MRIAITGGAGFVGSHAVERFAERGDDLFVIDNLSHGLRSHVPPGVDFHEDDICSVASRKALIAFAPDAVVHLAAQMSVTDSVMRPRHDAKVNIMGTLNMLEGAQAGGAKAFVFASSGGALYGDAKVLPATEATPVRPLSPYGMSKYFAEQYLEYFDGKQDAAMRCVSLRLSNVFGPRQSNAGEGGVISIFAKQMLLQTATPKIFGDGEQTRDFVFVQDVVHAIEKAIDTPARGPFNIGTGQQTSLMDLTATLREITGFSRPIEHVPPREGEVRLSALSADKAAAGLSWTPRVSLREGLEKTVKSFLAPPAPLPTDELDGPSAGSDTEMAEAA